MAVCRGENRSATPFTINLTCIALRQYPNLSNTQTATNHVQLQSLLPNFRSSVKKRRKHRTPVTRCLKIVRLWPVNHPVLTHVNLNRCRHRNNYTASARPGIYDVCTKGSTDKTLFTRQSFSPSLEGRLQLIETQFMYRRVCLTVSCSESLSRQVRTVWVHPPSHLNSSGGPPRVIKRTKQIPPFNTKGHTKHGAYLLHLLYRHTSVFQSFQMYYRYENLAC